LRDSCVCYVYTDQQMPVNRKPRGDLVLTVRGPGLALLISSEAPMKKPVATALKW